MGSFGDAVNRMMDEDPDIFKVKNNPDDGFAVDISIRFADILQMGQQQAIDTLEGVDDYDNPVRKIPLKWTGEYINCEILDVGLPIDFEEDEVPLGYFLYWLAKCHKELMESPEDYDIEATFPEGCFENLKLLRLVWLPDDEDWECLIDFSILETKGLMPFYPDDAEGFEEE